MIENEKQYEITKRWIKNFENGLIKLEQMPDSVDQPWLKNTQRNSIKGTLIQMYSEIVEYEQKQTHKARA